MAAVNGIHRKRIYRDMSHPRILCFNWHTSRRAILFNFQQLWTLSPPTISPLKGFTREDYYTLYTRCEGTGGRQDHNHSLYSITVCGPLYLSSYGDMYNHGPRFPRDDQKVIKLYGCPGCGRPGLGYVRLGNA